MSIRAWWNNRYATARAKLASVLIAEPGRRHFGYPLCKESGVRSGVLYPVLQQMLEDGWLTHGWESAAEADGRPPRRWYRLTDTGLTRLTAIVEKAGEEWE